MLPLRELQLHFAARLFEHGANAVDLYVRADGIDPGARLGIYRNNVLEAFCKTLALEFPVVERLVGSEYFRQLARDFLCHHPSKSGDLHHIGAPFESFLRERFSATQFVYLADVAALEWALQECLVAEETPPLDVLALRNFAAHSYGSLRFALRAGCRLVRSPFPVLHIWEVNQPHRTGDEVVSLEAGADHILVCRGAAGVRFHRLAPSEFELLRAFASGASLDQALEATLAVDADFDLANTLQRCVAIGALARLTLPTCEQGITP